MAMLFRTLSNGAAAVMVTAGLGLAMANLIKVEFTVQQDKPEVLSFKINEDVTELPPIDIKPPELKPVVPPPARPKVDTVQTNKVVVDKFDFEDMIPEIIPPVIDITAVTVRFDQDPSPIFRLAPVMPTRAERSGHCQMRFDINAHGIPFNVQAIYCSQSLFARASIKSVQGWKYRPEVKNGHAISHKGISTNIIFKLKDERGDLIQE